MVIALFDGREIIHEESFCQWFTVTTTLHKNILHWLLQEIRRV